MRAAGGTMMQKEGKGKTLEKSASSDNIGRPSFNFGGVLNFMDKASP